MRPRAFDSGPAPDDPQERQAVIANAVKVIEDRADEFKFLLKAETGQPQMIVDMLQYGAAVSGLQYYAAAATSSSGRTSGTDLWSDAGAARTGRRGRRGGGLERADVPGLQQTRPALLAGCTVVRPAAETPLSVNLLAEAFAEARLPEGAR